jgi:alpha-glucosidase
MTLKWWQRAVVYEIAPISFQDSDGDGKGDLGGLLQRIDYLQWLGVDALWLTPIYKSPFADFGYDIADFCAIDPVFGTMAQFDELVERLHAAGIRLILDFVPNHTSDQHAWFEESRASRVNRRRDWYIWADAAPNGGPPNNWLSRFGGSAWTWDGATGQYYYHSFLQEQPDLNWRNREVRAAVADVMRFWLSRGVDGFRTDAGAVLIEDALLRDDPPEPEADERTPPPQRLRRIFTDDRRESMACLEEIRAVLDEFGDRVLAGEVQGKTDRIGHFYGEKKPRLHLPLNFVLLDAPWNALSVQGEIDAYLNAIPEDAWPNWVIGGHDKKRVTDRLGQKRARVLAMLLLTLRGTPFFFAGDEIGMEPVEIPPEAVQDPFEKLVGGYGLNRDPERAPMRWDAGCNGGFTTGTPWLPMGNDIAARNVAVQRADPRSLLSLYRRLIELRRREKVLTAGAYVPLRSRNDIFAFKRVLEGDEIMVLLNIAPDPRRWDELPRAKLLLSTDCERRPGEPIETSVLLGGDEGLVLKVA